MNADEKIAYRYLCDRKPGDVVFEPDGNQPPDFLVDNRYAVEVRRLNQNWIAGSETQGLEKLRFPLQKAFDKLLTSLGPPSGDLSWFVAFRFKRPLVPWKRLKPLVHEYLEAFRLGKTTHTTISINQNFSVWLSPSTVTWPYYFVMAGTIDSNAGGFALSEVLKNVGICLTDKTFKVAKFRAKYPEWWLVLIDHIARDLLDDSDRATIRKRLSDKRGWDKIIIVNADNARSTFEG